MNRHRTWVEIDERALENNIAQLRGLLGPDTHFSAVVKGNAYGHGLVQTVRIAARAGVGIFAVDSLDEALEVRGLLPSAMVLVMGYVLHARLDEAVRNHIHLTVYDKETVQAVEMAAARTAEAASVHLKVDTGMSRQGVMPADLNDLLGTLANCPHIDVVGISTHFAVSGHASDVEYAMMQCRRFEEVLARSFEAGLSPKWIHCAKSSATILYPETHGTLVRPGIALYGIWPSAEVENLARKQGVKCDLQPVMTWRTRIAQIKTLPAGTPVGYDLTEILPTRSRIAVLPVGYHDGYDRRFSSRGYVLVGGFRCKVLGRVCMNMTMVDVSAVPNLHREMAVTLLGNEGRHRLQAHDLANWIGTNPYEIVTRIHPAVPRIPINGL